MKIYGWAWLALIVATIVIIAVMIICPSHHELAADPCSLEKIVKVDLPDIASVQTMDDGGGSRWDMFVHKGRFTEEISEESIQQMDELCLSDSMHWSKNSDKGYYIYSDEGGIDGLYLVSCTIYKDRFVTTYEVEESEGIFVLFALMVAYMILIASGIILLIIRLFRRKKEIEMKNILLIITTITLLSITSCSHLHNENYLQAAEEATTPNMNFLFASNASLPGRLYMTFSGKYFKPCINTVTTFYNKYHTCSNCEDFVKNPQKWNFRKVNQPKVGDIIIQHDSKTGRAYHAVILVRIEDGKYYVNHAVREGYLKNIELKTRKNLTYYEYVPSVLDTANNQFV